MKRVTTMIIAGVLACAPGADQASTDTAEQAPETSESTTVPAGWVDVPNGDRMVHTWIARPETEGPAPTIIVIHQNRGSSEWVRSVADRIAELGYIAAAPDLLSGTAPGGGNTDDYEDSDAARRGIGELPPEQVTADLDAVADYLVALPGSNGTVSVSGFCWGGSQTFRFATNRPDLTAAYVFYGTGPQEAEAIGNVAAPVYGFYGGNDNRVNSTIESSATLMTDGGKTYRPVIYPGAGHGFMSSGERAEEGDPNRAAMEQGWERWRDLLAEHAGN